MSHSRLAPVALFAFNRPETTLATLQALQRCDGFQGRQFYLFCDGPRQSRPEDVAAVASVRQLLQDWAAGQQAECLFSDTNRGLRASIVGGVREVLSSHSQVIVMEDDIVAAPGYLQFMQQSLDALQDVSAVWQVSGYFIPHHRWRVSPGFLGLPCCWGWGTWRDRWSRYCDNAADLAARIGNSDVQRFNIDGTYDYFGDLQANAEGRLNTWHVRWYASMFLQGALAFYPGRTLTRNIGFLDNGTHCSSAVLARVFHGQRLGRCPAAVRQSTTPVESPELRETLKQFYRYQQQIWQGMNWGRRLRVRVGTLLREAGLLSGRGAR